MRETSSLVLNIGVKTLSLRATTTSIVGERQFFLAPEGHTNTIPNGSLRRKPLAQTVSSPKRNFRGGCESGLRAEAPEALPRSSLSKAYSLREARPHRAVGQYAGTGCPSMSSSNFSQGFQNWVAPKGTGAAHEPALVARARRILAGRAQRTTRPWLARRPTNAAPLGCTRCHIGQMRLFALCTLRGAFRAGPPLLDSS